MAAVVIAPADRCTPYRPPASSGSRAGVRRPLRPAGPARVVRLDQTTYWRRRALALMAALLVLAGLGILANRALDGVMSWQATTPTQPAPDAVASTVSASESAEVYVVEPGDTLWSIAERIAPGEDPRPIVHRLAERAGGSGLRPGQRMSLAGIR
jgi:LysM domain-containing protein